MTAYESVGVTRLVHTQNQAFAMRVGQTILLGIASIDFITPDTSRSWREACGPKC